MQAVVKMLPFASAYQLFIITLLAPFKKWSQVTLLVKKSTLSRRSITGIVMVKQN